MPVIGTPVVYLFPAVNGVMMPLLDTELAR